MVHEASISDSSTMPSEVAEVLNDQNANRTNRTGSLWLALFTLLLTGSWAIYHFQYNNLPMPLTTEQAGKRGFSEVSALEHVKNLTGFGPHPVGSDALDLAIQYVMLASENIKKSAHWEVDVQVDFFAAKTGVNRLVGGLFKGKSLVYSDLKHVVLRISPKYQPEAKENAILVSSHIDTVFSTVGAGDCSSCVGVMLELARGISQWAHGFQNGVIFLFNTGEEEGLDGAHSFITQHPWRNTIRFIVDLEAMGVGGKSSIFQTSGMLWAIETYANVAKYPSGQIISQDVFNSGAIKSATDFQVYKEIAGLPGLDLAFSDYTAVYHTKKDMLKLLKPGSLQHLGENMQAFLLQVARSPDLHKMTAASIKGQDENSPIYFDILGMYMIVYSQHLASMLSNSVMLQALLLLITSVVMGGYSAAISFGLSCFSIILMWSLSLGLSILVAFIIPLISFSPVPYIASPWLVAGLFGTPAVLGAISGQHLGFLFLQKHLRMVISKRMEGISIHEENIVKWEAERWIFKAGLIQWLILLFVGSFYKIGSSYIALVWLVCPSFAYGLMEATLSSTRLPKQLKIATLFLSLTIPALLSFGNFIKLVGLLIGTLVRFDRNPGSSYEWLGNVILAAFVSSIVCLMLVYLLSYVHNSEAMRSIMLSMCALMGLTFIAIGTGFFPAFTEDISRAVNVVHVVETNGSYSHNQEPSSYVSFYSLTPGNLEVESKRLSDEGFDCGRKTTLDFVSFTVKYACLSFKDTDAGWTKMEIPSLSVESDSTSIGSRITRALVDTKQSNRWSLAINAELISEFSFEVNSEELLPSGKMSSVDGWHIIQFSGGKKSPKMFHSNLIWRKNVTHPSEGSPPALLLKLRTDINRVTPKTARVLEKLPNWCALFGKSTSPYTFAFLTSLPADF